MDEHLDALEQYVALQQMVQLVPKTDLQEALHAFFQVTEMRLKMEQAAAKATPVLHSVEIRTRGSHKILNLVDDRVWFHLMISAPGSLIGYGVGCNPRTFCRPVAAHLSFSEEVSTLFGVACLAYRETLKIRLDRYRTYQGVPLDLDAPDPCAVLDETAIKQVETIGRFLRDSAGVDVIAQRTFP